MEQVTSVSLERWMVSIIEGDEQDYDLIVLSSSKQIYFSGKQKPSDKIQVKV